MACGAENVDSLEPDVQVSTTVQEGDANDCVVNESGTFKLCTVNTTEVIPRILELRECDYNPSRCRNLGHDFDIGTDGKAQNKKIVARLYQFVCDGGNMV